MKPKTTIYQSRIIPLGCFCVLIIWNLILSWRAGFGLESILGIGLLVSGAGILYLWDKNRIPIPSEPLLGKTRPHTSHTLNTSNKGRDLVVRGPFLNNMSHEFRTPLNGVLGFSNLLLASDLDTTQKEYGQIIQDNAKLLLSLVEDMLDFSKLESGQFALEQISFNLEQLVARVVDSCRAKVGLRPVVLNYTYDPSLPSDFKGDPARVRQILINLLNNAIKFTFQGRIDLVVRPELETPRNIDGQSYWAVTFHFKDTGIGISDENQENVFDAFAQADAAINRKFSGTGLGLAITRSLIMALGGTISFTSQEGEGSEFTVLLNLPEEQGLVESNIHPLRRDELEGKKAILVDINGHARQILKAYLDQMMMDVGYLGDSAPKTIAWLQKREWIPDVIFTDILMPEMDGYAFARALRELPHLNNCKLIAVSSDAAAGSAKRAEQSGFDAYLSKPYTQEELMQLVSVTLGDFRTQTRLLTRHQADELSCKGLRVLVVDRVEKNLMLMEILLGKLGCEVTLVRSGESALEIGDSANFDLAFMALRLPDGAGIDFLPSMMRSSEEKFPIIGMATVLTEEDKTKAIEGGMSELLSYPIAMDKLKNILVRWGGTK